MCVCVHSCLFEYFYSAYSNIHFNIRYLLNSILKVGISWYTHAEQFKTHNKGRGETMLFLNICNGYTLCLVFTVHPGVDYIHAHTHSYKDISFRLLNFSSFFLGLVYMQWKMVYLFQYNNY